MAKKTNILVLDIGTTGIKGFVFNEKLEPLAKSYYRINKTILPGKKVEQDPQELLDTSKKALNKAVEMSGVSKTTLASLALTNQRETIIVWDKKTGTPLYPAIVWEDARTTAECKKLKKYEEIVRQKTGCTIDPYFSATKIRWILENVTNARQKAEAGELLCGTVDTWILWNFLGGKTHTTDYTNASRTLLYNIKTVRWDDELLKLFQIPKNMLPAVHPSASSFGMTKKEMLGISLPVRAVCGDQQASLYAAGTKKGTTKITYGTGAFVAQITGPVFGIHDRFFTTLAASSTKRPLYAVEAKINDSGKNVQNALDRKQSLEKVVTKIAREVANYTNTLPLVPKEIIIDGGVTQYEKTMEIQQTASGVPVKKQKIYDGTALGVARLAQTQIKN